jgi:Ca2+/Na+ antiporter
MLILYRLKKVGVRTGINGFFISFVFAPLASNASELIAAYKYSLKKTSKTITISLSTLQGAAVMNNSFSLGIFLALIYFRQLVWEYSAETLAILAVEVLMALISFRQTQRLIDALIVLSLYPASLALVVLLEKAGWN